MKKLLYTFFFGYAAFKWRRLIRTIYFIIVAFVLFVQQDRLVLDYYQDKKDKPKIEKLYNLYLEKGIISEAISLDKFKTSDKSQQQKLFDLGKSEGLFTTTTLKKFYTAWREPVFITSIKSAILFIILIILTPILISWLIKPFVVKEN